MASLEPRRAGTVSYTPPGQWETRGLFDLIEGIRTVPTTQQPRLLDARTAGVELYCAGDLSLVRRSCVAVVGTRKVSAEGAARTRRFAKELADAGVVVVSGLAEGVDHHAHSSAIESGGQTVAVIGTPLEQAYPASHKALQERIYREHLLISPFKAGTKVFPSNFPARNKVMAALSDATVIIEAGETSGTLHQAAECFRLGRPLFIAKSLLEPSRGLTWPKRFLETYPEARVLTATGEVLEAIAALR